MIHALAIRIHDPIVRQVRCLVETLHPCHTAYIGFNYYLNSMLYAMIMQEKY